MAAKSGPRLPTAKAQVNLEEHGHALADLDAALITAWADLQDARRAWSRSPNSETVHDAVIAEARVNRLLERRHVLATAEAMVRG